MFSKTFFVIIAAMAVCLACHPAAQAATAKPVKSPSTQHEMKTDSNEWLKVVEAARKEGKLIINGDPSEIWRKSLVDLFRQEYPEITVEYTGMNGRDFSPRLRRERELGQKLWDLLAGGTSTAYDT